MEEVKIYDLETNKCLVKEFKENGKNRDVVWYILAACGKCPCEDVCNKVEGCFNWYMSQENDEPSEDI